VLIREFLKSSVVNVVCEKMGDFVGGSHAVGAKEGLKDLYL
jgi:hypothetical protein